MLDMQGGILGLLLLLLLLREEESWRGVDIHDGWTDFEWINIDGWSQSLQALESQKQNTLCTTI